MKVDTGDWHKIRREIEQCQARVLQTLVPTILSLGLIAFSRFVNEAEVGSPPYITMGATFAVLLASSLYIASLSYKIFMNAGFLSVFAEKKPDTIYWEDVVVKFRELAGRPRIIHSETTTAAMIYIILTAIYVFIFASLSAVRASLGAMVFLIISTLLLISVAIRIYWAFYDSKNQKDAWQQIYDSDYSKENKESS